MGSVPAPLGPTDLPADPPPVALVAEVRGKTRVVALNGAAARCSVARAMTLAEARALTADLVALPWDGDELARAAREVLTALLAASPRVAWAGNAAVPLAGVGEVGLWWVDAAGLGSEAKLAHRLTRIASGLGFGRSRVGVADSAIAAYAAAVSGHRGTGAQGHGHTHGGTDAPKVADSTPRVDPAIVCRCPGAPVPRCTGPLVRSPALSLVRPVVIPPGGDAVFVAPFPLALLQPGEDIAEACHALGLRTIGQFAGLHADEIETRFGPEGLALHRLARGLDTRGPTTPRDEALPLVTCDLASPVATAEPLLFVLRGALASLGATLRAKGLAAREIALTLTLDDGATAEKIVRPARPTSHEGALFDHCRAAFEGWALPEPVTALAVRAAVTIAASGEQGDLLAPRWADPSALAAAFDRIRGSEGADAVAKPVAVDGHLPQDAGTWSTGADALTSGRADTPAHRRTDAPTHEGTGTQEHRGTAAQAHTAAISGAGPPERAAALRLLPSPAPIRVRLGRAGIEAFHHDEMWHDVTAWSGPERLAPKWWTTGAATTSAGPHDYYSTRTADGALWLLFRASASHGWFVEGWWD